MQKASDRAFRIRSYNKIHLKSWVISLDKNGFVPCAFKNCNYLALDVEDMSEHFVVCNGHCTAGMDQCRICSRTTQNRAKLLSHLVYYHPLQATKEEKTELAEMTRLYQEPPKASSKVLLHSWELFFSIKGYVKCLVPECYFLFHDVDEIKCHQLTCCPVNINNGPVYICHYCQGKTFSQEHLNFHISCFHSEDSLLKRPKIISRFIIQQWCDRLSQYKVAKCATAGCRFVETEFDKLKSHYQFCYTPDSEQLSVCNYCCAWLLDEGSLVDHINSYHSNGTATFGHHLSEYIFALIPNKFENEAEENKYCIFNEDDSIAVSSDNESSSSLSSSTKNDQSDQEEDEVITIPEDNKFDTNAEQYQNSTNKRPVLSVKGFAKPKRPSGIDCSLAKRSSYQVSKNYLQENDWVIECPWLRQKETHKRNGSVFQGPSSSKYCNLLEEQSLSIPNSILGEIAKKFTKETVAGPKLIVDITANDQKWSVDIPQNVINVKIFDPKVAVSQMKEDLDKLLTLVWPKSTIRNPARARERFSRHSKALYSDNKLLVVKKSIPSQKRSYKRASCYTDPPIIDFSEDFESLHQSKQRPHLSDHEGKPELSGEMDNNTVCNKPTITIENGSLMTTDHNPHGSIVCNFNKDNFDHYVNDQSIGKDSIVEISNNQISSSISSGIEESNVGDINCTQDECDILTVPTVTYDDVENLVAPANFVTVANVNKNIINNYSKCFSSKTDTHNDTIENKQSKPTDLTTIENDVDLFKNKRSDAVIEETGNKKTHPAEALIRNDCNSKQIQHFEVADLNIEKTTRFSKQIFERYSNIEGVNSEFDKGSHRRIEECEGITMPCDINVDHDVLYVFNPERGKQERLSIIEQTLNYYVLKVSNEELSREHSSHVQKSSKVDIFGVKSSITRSTIENGVMPKKNCNIQIGIVNVDSRNSDINVDHCTNQVLKSNSKKQKSILQKRKMESFNTNENLNLHGCGTDLANYQRKVAISDPVVNYNVSPNNNFKLVAQKLHVNSLGNSNPQNSIHHEDPVVISNESLLCNNKIKELASKDDFGSTGSNFGHDPTCVGFRGFCPENVVNKQKILFLRNFITSNSHSDKIANKSKSTLEFQHSNMSSENILTKSTNSVKSKNSVQGCSSDCAESCEEQVSLQRKRFECSEPGTVTIKEDVNTIAGVNNKIGNGILENSVEESSPETRKQNDNSENVLVSLNFQTLYPDKISKIGFQKENVSERTFLSKSAINKKVDRDTSSNQEDKILMSHNNTLFYLKQEQLEYGIYADLLREENNHELEKNANLTGGQTLEHYCCSVERTLEENVSVQNSVILNSYPQIGMHLNARKQNRDSLKKSNCHIKSTAYSPTTELRRTQRRSKPSLKKNQNDVWKVMKTNHCGIPSDLIALKGGIKTAGTLNNIDKPQVELRKETKTLSEEHNSKIGTDNCPIKSVIVKDLMLPECKTEGSNWCPQPENIKVKELCQDEKSQNKIINDSESEAGNHKLIHSDLTTVSTKPGRKARSQSFKLHNKFQESVHNKSFACDHQKNLKHSPPESLKKNSIAIKVSNRKGVTHFKPRKSFGNQARILKGRISSQTKFQKDKQQLFLEKDNETNVYDRIDQLSYDIILAGQDNPDLSVPKKVTKGLSIVNNCFKSEIIEKIVSDKDSKKIRPNCSPSFTDLGKAPKQVIKIISENLSPVLAVEAETKTVKECKKQGLNQDSDPSFTDSCEKVKLTNEIMLISECTVSKVDSETKDARKKNCEKLVVKEKSDARFNDFCKGVKTHNEIIKSVLENRTSGLEEELEIEENMEKEITVANEKSDEHFTNLSQNVKPTKEYIKSLLENKASGLEDELDTEVNKEKEKTVANEMSDAHVNDLCKGVKPRNEIIKGVLENRTSGLEEELGIERDKEKEKKVVNEKSDVHFKDLCKGVKAPNEIIKSVLENRTSGLEEELEIKVISEKEKPVANEKSDARFKDLCKGVKPPNEIIKSVLENRSSGLEEELDTEMNKEKEKTMANEKSDAHIKDLCQNVKPTNEIIKSVLENRTSCLEEELEIKVISEKEKTVANEKSDAHFKDLCKDVKPPNEIIESVLENRTSGLEEKLEIEGNKEKEKTAFKEKSVVHFKDLCMGVNAPSEIIKSVLENRTSGLEEELEIKVISEKEKPVANEKSDAHFKDLCKGVKPPNEIIKSVLENRSSGLEEELDTEMNKEKEKTMANEKSDAHIKDLCKDVNPPNEIIKSVLENRTSGLEEELEIEENMEIEKTVANEKSNKHFTDLCQNVKPTNEIIKSVLENRTSGLEEELEIKVILGKEKTVANENSDAQFNDLCKDIKPPNEIIESVLENRTSGLEEELEIKVISEKEKPVANEKSDAHFKDLCKGVKPPNEIIKSVLENRSSGLEEELDTEMNKEKEKTMANEKSDAHIKDLCKDVNPPNEIIKSVLENRTSGLEEELEIEENMEIEKTVANEKSNKHFTDLCQNVKPTNEIIKSVLENRTSGLEEELEIKVILGKEKTVANENSDAQFNDLCKDIKPPNEIIESVLENGTSGLEGVLKNEAEEECKIHLFKQNSDLHFTCLREGVVNLMHTVSESSTSRLNKEIDTVAEKDCHVQCRETGTLADEKCSKTVPRQKCDSSFTNFCLTVQSPNGIGKLISENGAELVDSASKTIKECGKNNLKQKSGSEDKCEKNVSKLKRNASFDDLCNEVKSSKRMRKSDSANVDFTFKNHDIKVPVDNIKPGIDTSEISLCLGLVTSPDEGSVEEDSNLCGGNECDEDASFREFSHSNLPSNLNSIQNLDVTNDLETDNMSHHSSLDKSVSYLDSTDNSCTSKIKKSRRRITSYANNDGEVIQDLKERIDAGHKLKNPKKMVKCALCAEEMTAQVYQRVHLKKHNFMCWLEEEPPLPLDNFEFMSLIMTRGKRVYPKFIFKCDQCNIKKKSADGFLIHKRKCGIPAQQLNNLKVACKFCLKKFLIPKMEHHVMAAHSQISNTFIKKTDFQDRSVPKRAAASECLNKMVTMDDEDSILQHNVFYCPECSFGTPFFSELKLHINNDHSKLLTSEIDAMTPHLNLLKLVDSRIWWYGLESSISATKELRNKNYSQDSLHLDFQQNIDAFKMLSVDEYSSHLPEAKKSMKFCNGNTEWLEMDLFECSLSKESQLMYCGGPVWAMSWCPTEGQQYLAVSTLHSMNAEYTIGVKKKHPGLVQLWRFNNLNNERSSHVKPSFVYGLAHNYGAIWALEWCPSGGSSDNRLGLAAMATSSAMIPLYAFPQPTLFSNRSKQKELIFTAKPSLVLEQFGHEKVQCTSISWSKIKPHNLIVGGFVNGMVAVWDLESTSALLRDGQILYPYKVFYPHFSIITGVELTHSSNNMLVTASLDRSAKIWDLRDTTVPYSVQRKRMTTGTAWLSNLMASVNSYDDGHAKSTCSLGMNFLKNFASHSHPLISATESNSSAWSVSANDWINSIVASFESGNVTLIYGVQEERKKFPKIIVQSKLKPLDSPPIIDKKKKRRKAVTGNDSVTPNFDCNDTLRNYGLKISLDTDMDGPDKLLDDNDNVMKVFPLSSANKVCWNPNETSYLNLAVGYQSGFVLVTKVTSLPNDLYGARRKIKKCGKSN